MIRAILTDIEGTTSSIAFVHEVLFPYAQHHMADFIRAHAGDAHVSALLDDVRREAGKELDIEGCIAELDGWMREDRKLTPLKALQGLVWEAGYRQGDFKGHVYADAAAGLRRWHARGLRLYVYSSGSVQAQKLLFSHTQYGDLTPLFSAYFDTRIGHKRDPRAYHRIVAEIGLPANQVLFLSDIGGELDAASEAGLATTQLVRDGDVAIADGHPRVASFDAIELP